MKIITLTIILLVISFNSEIKKTKITSNYSCPTIEKDGRCTGSSSCSVCSNCSRCAHCSNGGSCGVCSGSSNNLYSSKPKRKYKSHNPNYYSAPSESKIYYENETITIYSKLINVRELPSIKSKVIKQLSYGDVVVYLQKEGEWSRIQVVETAEIGYVLTKLLN